MRRTRWTRRSQPTHAICRSKLRWRTQPTHAICQPCMQSDTDSRRTRGTLQQWQYPYRTRRCGNSWPTRNASRSIPVQHHKIVCKLECMLLVRVQYRRRAHVCHMPTCVVPNKSSGGVHSRKCTGIPQHRMGSKHQGNA